MSSRIAAVWFDVTGSTLSSLPSKRCSGDQAAAASSRLQTATEAQADRHGGRGNRPHRQSKRTQAGGEPPLTNQS
jgi:hypothetical protein